MSFSAKAGRRHALSKSSQSSGSFFSRVTGLSLASLCLGLYLAVDLFLVLCTAVLEYSPGFPLLGSFNLGVEHTVGVWWSTVTLLLAALLFYSGRHTSSANKIAGIVAAAIMAGLSLDELASVHERIAGHARWENLVPFALVGGCMLGWTLWRWMADAHTRPSALLLIAGFVCFGSVVVQEVLEHAVDWPAWSVGIRTGVEEGVELAGTLLCLLAALRFHQPEAGEKIQSPGYPLNLAYRLPLIPDLFILASVGLVLHIIASIVAPHLTGYPGRGNPAMWFPTCAWALVCLSLLRRVMLKPSLFSQGSLLLGALLIMFMLLSMVHAVFVYPISPLMTLVLRNGGGLAIAVVTLLSLGLPLKQMLALCVPAALSLFWFLATGSVIAAFLVSGASAYAVMCGFSFLDRAKD